MSTPHINAKKGDFAKTVLLPGDPLRAKFIAENFLEDIKQVTNVRNMLGFTGKYKGKEISVMGSGMGIPSCSIYAKELITEYGVQNLVRVGSCGAVQEDVKVHDIIIASGASTDSSVNRMRFLNCDYSAIPSFELLHKAYEKAKELNLSVKVGNIFSSDLFYHPLEDMVKKMQAMKILAVEMEAAGLYGCAAEFGANSLAVLTVSDHIITGESLSSDDREKLFKQMMELSLEAFA